MLNCYRVNFSTVRVVDGSRLPTSKTRFIVASSTVSAGTYVEGAELVDGVDEVHVHHVSEVAKDVTVIPMAVEASQDTHLADDHPQMSGVLP